MTAFQKNNPGIEKQIPAWRRRSVVYAQQITAQFGTDLVLGEAVHVIVPKGLIGDKQSVVGDYLLIHDGGGAAIWPRKAFEQDFVQVT